MFQESYFVKKRYIVASKTYFPVDASDYNKYGFVNSPKFGKRTGSP